METTQIMTGEACHQSSTTTAHLAVAEIQGLYGPFSFPEKLLQQIWARGDFDKPRAATADGRPIEILHPGKWNLLGGPDFRGARLRIGGVAVTGDVELHLRAQDWAAHGHAADLAYDHVVLHVVLFPSSDRATRGDHGREIPIFALLPLLHHDLEEYAAEDAVERLANHPLARVEKELASLSEAELRIALRKAAHRRWEQKVGFARLRLDRLGWESACHHAALEVLGYRFNRAPMLDVAGALPVEAWRARAATPTFADEAFTVGQGRWSLQGVRPANHPKARLKQYAAWVAARPRWADLLQVFVGKQQKLPGPLEVENATAAFRRAYDLSSLRQAFEEEVCGGAVGGTRLDNLICDGFLPLIAARNPRDAAAAAGLWYHWYLGDVPDRWLSLLRALGGFAAPDWPGAHGPVQGLLGWLVADEQRQSAGG